jgi:hypothetical protein
MGRTLTLELALVVALGGCATGGPRSPQDLRDRYLDALATDDPKATYALLSDELRAEIPYPVFEARWKAQRAERAQLEKAGRALPDSKRPAVHSATTTLENGHILRWALVGKTYYVVDGLPGTVRTATPGQAIRALIAAVRRTDLSAVRALLGDDLAMAIDEDWSARVEAMEAALDRPGSIELSADLRRAELTYDPGRVLTLEQTPRGWRITSLE